MSNFQFSHEIYRPIPSDGLAQWYWALRPMPKGSMSRLKRLKRISSKVIASRFGKTVLPTHDSAIDTSPFVSSSHILFHSNIIIGRSTKLSDITDCFKSFAQKQCKVAVHTSRFSEFLRYLIVLNIDSSFWTVYVIRGNSYFNREILSQLEWPFKKLYIHNLLGKEMHNEKLFPLPLGINPNLTRDLNYLNNLKANSQKKFFFEEKKYLVLMNFDSSTNFTERSSIIKQYKGKKEISWIPRINPGDLFSSYYNSYFVISPPGAGPDCYRTWEAIVAGAIPIVLDSETPYFHENFPIWRVDNWSQINDLSSEELLSKYLMIKNHFGELPEAKKYDL